MPNPFFQFKQFTVFQDRSAMKVTTDACLFGAWCASELQARNISQLLDVGAGTGLLSLMIAQKNNIHIDAVEIEESAAGQAKANVAASPWQERIRVHEMDVLDLESPGKYEVIVSNPPFYENEIGSQELKKNLAHHSSQLSLKQLFPLGKKLLRDTGLFYLLLPYKRTKEVERLLKNEQFFIPKKVVVHPSSSQPPFRIMLVAQNQPCDTITTSLSIKKDTNHYSDKFVSLLRDYYLHL